MNLKIRKLNMNLTRRTTMTEHADTATLHVVDHCAYNVQQIPEPGTLDEAFGSPHVTEWKLATDSKYSINLIVNDTWDLHVYYSKAPRRTPVRCK